MAEETRPAERIDATARLPQHEFIVAAGIHPPEQPQPAVSPSGPASNAPAASRNSSAGFSMTQMALLTELMMEVPYQPATNYWRAVKSKR